MAFGEAMRRTFLAVVISLVAYAAGATIRPAEVAGYIARIVSTENADIDIDLDCLADQDIEQIRATRSLNLAFPKCREELLADLGEAFAGYDDDALKAILATIASARFALYGPSNALSYEEIAASAYLNCGNTILLAGFLFDQGDTRVRPIGFDGGAVGNHAQLLFFQNDDPDDENDLLLDPTFGIVAITSLNSLLSGREVPDSRIRRFAIKDKSIKQVQGTVFASVAEGRYKPSDFMYLHESVGAMYKFADLSHYFTPGGIYLRNLLSRQDSSARK